MHPTFCENKPSILIVDDNEIFLELLADAFKMFGLIVFTAKTGFDGLHLFKKEITSTVLTDIRMPGDLDGAELSCRIRKQSPHTTIAVMTGGDGEVGGKLLKNGTADYFCTKPFSLSYVCKTLLGEHQKTCFNHT
jgi:DNA-binding response OmpR family regulator